MKKRRLSGLSLFLSVLLVCSGCASQDPAKTAATEPSQPIHLVAMKGPTGMGLVKYARDQETDPSSGLDFRIETMPEAVVVGLAKGEVDVAAVPANLAATLYQKMEGKVQVAAILVSNVLYFAGNGTSLQTLTDLRGKTVYTSGRGATPEATLTILLEAAGLEPGRDVDLEFSTEATEVGAKLASEAGSVAFLQEPFLTAVRRKNPDVSVLFSAGDLWQQGFGPESSIVTGVLVVRKDFIQEDPQRFRRFLEDAEASVRWVKENPTAAAGIIADYGIVDAETAEKALPGCGISFTAGEAMKKSLKGYLEALYGFDPKLTGGELPGDDFYYPGE